MFQNDLIKTDFPCTAFWIPMPLIDAVKCRITLGWAMGITNFWSIVLNDYWSKKIYRQRWLLMSCAIFISDDLVSQGRKERKQYCLWEKCKTQFGFRKRITATNAHYKSATNAHYGNGNKFIWKQFISYNLRNQPQHRLWKKQMRIFALQVS